MDLKQMTLDGFLCRPDNIQVVPSVAVAMDFSIFYDFLGAHHRNLNDSSYSLHWFGGSEVNILLLEGQEIIGSYCGDALWIAETHQGQELSVPIILAAVENREPPLTRQVTNAGLAALEKAWRVTNEIEASPWT